MRMRNFGKTGKRRGVSSGPDDDNLLLGSGGGRGLVRGSALAPDCKGPPSYHYEPKPKSERGLWLREALVGAVFVLAGVWALIVAQAVHAVWPSL